MRTRQTMNNLIEQVEDDEYDTSIPDESLVEIAKHCPELNEQQRRYVYWRIVGTNPTIAFRNAGYSGSSWKTVESRPKVREAVAKMIEVIEPEIRVTQKTILNITMDAINIAREKSQAIAMVTGAKLLAEVTGNLAAQKIDMRQQSQIDVNHTHSLSNETKMLQQLPRGQLERLLELDRVLPHTNVLEGEFDEVRED